MFKREPHFLEFPLTDVPTTTRAKFATWCQSQPLEYLDAYAPWSVPARAQHVALLEPDDISMLNPSTRMALNRAQIEFNRGSVYPLKMARDFAIPTEFLERDTIDDQFLLRFDAWHALPEAAQFDWLQCYVNSDGLTSLESRHPLIGFSANSGPNCFATTLAAIEPNQTEALKVAQTWLHQPKFLQKLENLNYNAPQPYDGSPLPPRAVLLFKDSNGLIVHAAAHLENNLMLNKDAQSWHRPRQVLKLEDLLERWAEDRLELWLATKR